MHGPRYQLTNRDAVEWLRDLPSGSADLVITDPAYESLEKHRRIGTTTRLKHSKASSNDWFTIFPNARFGELFQEIYRVLRNDSHFYLFCDQETMFVAKPIAEEVGFKFWKPIVWDKCLGPDTPVWTARGVRPIAELREGDCVSIPEGGTARVRATRRTRAPALRLSLSDGTELIASREHRFVLSNGRQVEARELQVGSGLCTRPVQQEQQRWLHLDGLIPEHERVLELPETTSCIWCGQSFGSPRAASAHQARFCRYARSKKDMAAALGISPKRLRRWMSERSIPARWARALGLREHTSRPRLALQNDAKLWFPERIPLDHELGKLIGLFAAEGSWTQVGVSFALHSHEKHLQNHIARVVRSLGARASVYRRGNSCVVDVGFKLIKYLVRHFVGGASASEKYLRSSVYAAPSEFRQGVLVGILEGDGHWSHDEQRETLNTSSLDLAMFVRRELSQRGIAVTIRRFENDHAGGWRVRFDPTNSADSLTVDHIEEAGERELVDISIEHPDELFVLGNGVVTHNCKIGMGYHYRARYELILFFEKGKRKLNDLGVADIIEVPRIYKGYPAQKPVEVSEVLVTQSSQPGQLVIDPFAGSGSVGVAAAMHRRDFAGTDICAEAVQIAEARLVEAGAVPGKLFDASGAPSDQLGLFARGSTPGSVVA